MSFNSASFSSIAVALKKKVKNVTNIPDFLKPLRGGICCTGFLNFLSLGFYGLFSDKA